MNLIEALQQANNKSRRFIAQLDRTAKMIGAGDRAEDDPGLALSKAITEALIQATDRAIASGDLQLMLSMAGFHGLDAPDEESAENGPRSDDRPPANPTGRDGPRSSRER